MTDVTHQDDSSATATVASEAIVHDRAPGRETAQTPSSEKTAAGALRVAYLASKFPFPSQTFVLNEVEAHHREGVEILPLSCDRQGDESLLSNTGRKWARQTVTPGSLVNRFWCVVRECFRSPIGTIRNVCWLIALLFVDPIEFLKGVKEFFAAASLARAVRQADVQLIHVHFASRSLNAGIMLSHLTGVPVSCTIHAFELWFRSGRNLRFRLKNCLFIATESEYHVRYIREKCGEKIGALCHVIHNGVDISQFDADRHDPVSGRIVLISRLAEKKGHKYLIEACSILKERQVECECVIVGGGEDYDTLAKQIKELGVGQSVRLVGPAANDQLRRYLDSAAVLALPAIVASDGDQDGIPLALVEAMACGVPVVSTNVAGIPELLRDGEAGCIVPQRDSQALADALESLLADEDRQRQLSVEGRKMVEAEFDIIKSAVKLRTRFGAAIAEDKAKRSK